MIFWLKRLICREELEELQDLRILFEMQHKAEERALQKWREETGKHNCLPDHKEMFLWLLREVTEQAEHIRHLEEVREKLRLKVCRTQPELSKCKVLIQKHRARIIELEAKYAGLVQKLHNTWCFTDGYNEDEVETNTDP